MTEFEESEDDNDDLNDTHAITFPPINLDGIDDMTAPQPPQNNGKRIRLSIDVLASAHAHTDSVSVCLFVHSGKNTEQKVQHTHAHTAWLLNLLFAR